MHGWGFCVIIILLSFNNHPWLRLSSHMLWPSTPDLFHPFGSTGTEDKNALNETALPLHLQLIWHTKCMIWSGITFCPGLQTVVQIHLQKGCCTKHVHGALPAHSLRTEQGSTSSSSPSIRLLLQTFLNGFGLQGTYLDIDEKCYMEFSSHRHNQSPFYI